MNWKRDQRVAPSVWRVKEMESMRKILREMEIYLTGI